MAQLRLGACSWKYPSWAGLVYSAPTGVNYPEQYARHYDTVEVDQWFWSRFETGEPKRAPDRLRPQRTCPPGVSRRWR